MFVQLSFNTYLCLSMGSHVFICFRMPFNEFERFSILCRTLSLLIHVCLRCFNVLQCFSIMHKVLMRLSIFHAFNPFQCFSVQCCSMLSMPFQCVFNASHYFPLIFNVFQQAPIPVHCLSMFFNVVQCFSMMYKGFQCSICSTLFNTFNVFKCCLIFKRLGDVH